MINNDNNNCNNRPETIINVPSQNVEVEVRVGDIVTINYEKNIKRESLFNTFIIRVRKDYEWEDVVRDYNNSKLLNGMIIKRNEKE